MKKTVLTAIIASTVATSTFAQDSINPFADEKSGFYLGIGAGKSSYDAYGDIEKDSQEELSQVKDYIKSNGGNAHYDIKGSNTSNIGKIFLGYRVNKYLGVELDYNQFSNADYKLNGSGSIKESDISLSGELNGKVTSKIKGIGIKTIGFYPVTNNIDLKASAGIMRWKIKEKHNLNYSGSLNTGDFLASLAGPSESNSESKSGNSLTLGLGANYNITNNVTVGLQWERIKDVGHKDLAFGETDIDTYTLSAQYNF
ncbi:outer membrane beta-barrel protein [Spartinivicinus poritis]|uniref:Outer membrane beta-barrel protein n=1 Tax=Spartinivicinus poritis TaxID=2994640 RepID=A0ABT5UBG4_9GAMM|nr:outer membrane beta-barrel protein [Spartinivicinus sp. A2-2]MDE1462867.1 outer membrane beta-barrel protein [Spartinivicinus sp. A2-2]